MNHVLPPEVVNINTVLVENNLSWDECYDLEGRGAFDDCGIPKDHAFWRLWYAFCDAQKNLNDLWTGMRYPEEVDPEDTTRPASR